MNTLSILCKKLEKDKTERSAGRIQQRQQSVMSKKEKQWN